LAATQRPTTTNWSIAPWKWAPSGAAASRRAACRIAWWWRAPRPASTARRLLADTHKICEAEIRFWHGAKKPPFQNYLFMLNAVDDGYGGLEHRNSTALICKRQDLPRVGEPRTSEGYTTLRGLISHEYFHTWNVKRLRPAEFESYDYAGENYTRMLWFFEGFTSYYDDLCCAAPACWTTPATSSCSTRPSTRSCRRRAGWCSRWPKPALTPG
jgi:predicted metalloprotease with PDZ domain